MIEPSMNADGSLWEEVLAGDGEAFAALFDRHRQRVLGQALRQVASPHDAEDITAVVFLEVWRNRSRVRIVDGTLLPWLLVTTNHVIQNHARSIRRYRLALAKLPPSASTRDGVTDVDERLDSAAARKRVRDSFARLSKADQDVLTLCILNEYTLAQAARTLDLPVGTVKSRLSRAKRRLGEKTQDSLSTLTTGGAK
jgi:RNA polymerase sigma factor (sigma-70 family)